MTDGGYREHPARLPGAVVWTRRAPAAVSGDEPPARVLPDGCIDLIWTAGRVLIAGPDTRAQVVPVEPGVDYVGLRMPPGIGPAVLGVPAHLLRDLRVPLDQVWPRTPSDRDGEGLGVARLEEMLAAANEVAAGDPAAVGAVLADVVRRRLATAFRGEARRGAPPVPDAAVRHAVALLRRGSSVAQAAASVGLGERRLHRRSLVAFGYGPQMLARILRLGHALDLARRGVPAATVAATAGYADQPHLAREVRQLAGVPLTTLVGTGRDRSTPVRNAEAHSSDH
jgi:AraC-like DNA-binding protein